MLHTKFQGPIGSGEEDFLRSLPYLGMVAMLPRPFEQLFFLKALEAVYEIRLQSAY